jgi:hypothetical protein
MKPRIPPTTVYLIPLKTCWGAGVARPSRFGPSDSTSIALLRDLRHVAAQGR